MALKTVPTKAITADATPPTTKCSSGIIFPAHLSTLFINFDYCFSSFLSMSMQTVWCRKLEVAPPSDSDYSHRCSSNQRSVSPFSAALHPPINNDPWSLSRPSLCGWWPFHCPSLVSILFATCFTQYLNTGRKVKACFPMLTWDHKEHWRRGWFFWGVCVYLESQKEAIKRDEMFVQSSGPLLLD